MIKLRLKINFHDVYRSIGLSVILFQFLPYRSFVNIFLINVTGANTINYVTARNRVGAVADQVARMLNFLADNGSISGLSQISIAGMMMRKKTENV